MARYDDKALRAEIEAGKERAALLKVRKIAATEQKHKLADGLRNLQRTATRKLDEAGVPDNRQGLNNTWDDWQ